MLFAGESFFLFSFGWRFSFFSLSVCRSLSVWLSISPLCLSILLSIFLSSFHVSHSHSLSLFSLSLLPSPSILPSLRLLFISPSAFHPSFPPSSFPPSVSLRLPSLPLSHSPQRSPYSLPPTFFLSFFLSSSLPPPPYLPP